MRFFVAVLRVCHLYPVWLLDDATLDEHEERLANGIGQWFAG